MNIWIDNKIYKNIPKGCNVIDICKNYNIEIDTLCYDKELNNNGKCGLCCIEVNNKITTACTYIPKNNDKIITQNTKLFNIRKNILNNICNKYNFNSKQNNNNVLLLNLFKKYDIKPQSYNSKITSIYKNDSLLFDKTKCVGCNKCQKTCELNSVNAIKIIDRKLSIDKKKCILCGQCNLVCPSNAISEIQDIDKLKNVLKEKYTICAIAPSARISLLEYFKQNKKIKSIKNIYSLLRIIGFKKIFDLNYGADLTIIEEAFEFINRLGIEPKINNFMGFKLNKHNLNKFPMFTSCCSGWVNMVKNFFPNIIENISTTKSPQQIFGAAVQMYIPKKLNIPKNKINIVTIMPCTAKKHEATLYKNDGINIVLTVKEIIKYIEENNILDMEIKEENADSLMSEYSTSGAIFGNTGGVMEAALRTINYMYTGNNKIDIAYKNITNVDNDIKEAKIKINNKDINICVVNGVKNVFKLFVNNLYKKYHFIEVMACHGGCINGGGQPNNIKELHNKIIQDRSKAILGIEKNNIVHYSHQNNEIISMYNELKISPNDKTAYTNFHIKYKKN